MNIKQGFFAICVLMLCIFSPVNEQSNQKNEWEMYSYSDFKSSSGDYFVADLENGIGYLANDANKSFTIFPLLSGQRRNICYIGRCYYGATPEKIWEAKKENIQSDRITFSKSGKFLRLFDGDKSTHYGIHGHAYFDQMIKKDTKFQSMGCILVPDDALDTVEGSFIANTDSLKVITKNKIGISFLFLLHNVS